MEIQYDPSKAELNERKHGVSFDEATSVLFDPMGLSFEDNDSENEHRWVLLGMSSKDRLLVVVYTRHSAPIPGKLIIYLFITETSKQTLMVNRSR